MNDRQPSVSGPDNSDEVEGWFQALKDSIVYSERDESLETGRHFTGVDGNTISVLSERVDGSYYLNVVTVETDDGA